MTYAHIRDERGVFQAPRFLLLYLAAIGGFWILYPSLSQHNLDNYADMLEAYMWGSRWQLGNSSHPPLYGWLVAAWFEVFPRTNLAYRAFAALNIVISLFLMTRIAARLLTAEQSEIALVCALVLPMLGFQAFTYNANSAMLPFWAGTILLVLRQLERPNRLESLLLGAVAAMDILSKYYMATLLIALLIYAIFNPAARRILFSSIGAIAFGAFLVVLTPHIVWLFGNDFRPFVFAAREQGDTTLANMGFRAVEFIVAQLLYVLPGYVILVFWRRRGDGIPLLAVRRDSILGNQKGRFLAWTFIGSTGVALLLSVVVWSPLTSNWALPAHIVVPVLLASVLPAAMAQKHRHMARIVGTGFIAFMLALSPLIYQMQIKGGTANVDRPIRQMIAQVQTVWTDESGNDISYIMADNLTMAAAAVFYVGNSDPLAIPISAAAVAPWIDRSSLATNGAHVLCARQDCLSGVDFSGWTVRALSPVVVQPLEGSDRSALTVYLWHLQPGGDGQ